MLIDREVVLNELNRRIVAADSDFFERNVASLGLDELKDFRTFIESLPPPADVSELVRDARNMAVAIAAGPENPLAVGLKQLLGNLADSLEAHEKKLAHVLELNAKLSDENERLEGSVHYRAVQDLEKKLAVARDALEDICIYHQGERSCSLSYLEDPKVECDCHVKVARKALEDLK